MISLFADSGPAVHVAPGTDFTLFGLHITNSMFYGWIILLLSILLLTWAARKITVRPKGGAVQYVEAGVSFVSDLVENAFTDKKVGRKYVPFFVTIFFMVLLCNWSGLIPGVGDALQIGGHPLLRPWTADLNATLSLGLVTMVVVYAASIKEIGGFRKYVRHFFIGSPLNPLYLVIGIIEMITDLDASAQPGAPVVPECDYRRNRHRGVRLPGRLALPAQHSFPHYGRTVYPARAGCRCPAGLHFCHPRRQLSGDFG